MEKNAKSEVEEITKYFNQIGLRIDKSLIENPEKEQIIELYMSLFDKLGIFQRSYFNLTSGEQSQFVGQINYENFTKTWKVFYITKYFLKKLKIDNVYMTDFINPQPKRTRTFLLKIIRYCKSKESEKQKISSKIERKRTLFKSIPEKENYKKNKESEKQARIKCKKEAFQSESKTIEELKIVENEKTNFESKIGDIDLRSNDIQHNIEVVQKNIGINKNILDQVKIDINLGKKKVVKSPIKVIQYANDINKRLEEASLKNGKDEERIVNLNSLIPKFQNLNELLNSYDQEKQNEEFSRKNSADVTSKCLHQYDIIGVKRREFDDMKVELEAKNSQEIELNQGIEVDNLQKNAANEERQKENISSNNQLNEIMNNNILLKNKQLAAENKIKEEEEKLTELNNTKEEIEKCIVAQIKETEASIIQFCKIFPEYVQKNYDP